MRNAQTPFQLVPATFDRSTCQFGNPYMPAATTAVAVTSGTAYYTFIGRATRTTLIKYVEMLLAVNGAGSQTGEVALFYGTSAPNRAAPSLTALTSTGSVDSVTSGAAKVVRNSSAFTVPVNAGMYIWAATRWAMATTQPTFVTLTRDFGVASVFSVAGSSALTSVATVSGGTVPGVNSTFGPDIRVSLV